MALRAEYIVGKKSNKEWSGIYGYRPEDEGDLRKLGEMYAVARIKAGNKSFSSEKFAKLVIEELQNAYFEELEIDSTLKRLEEACWKMKSRMDLLLSREPELAETGIDMEMAIVVFVGKFMYAVTIGESYILIKREDQIVNLAEVLTDINRSGFIKSGSLEINESDRFLISTSKGFTDTSEVEQMLSNLTIDLYDNENRDGLSLMMIADENLEWDSALENVEESIPMSDIPIDSGSEDLDLDEDPIEAAIDQSANELDDNLHHPEKTESTLNSFSNEDMEDATDFEDGFEYEDDTLAEERKSAALMNRVHSARELATTKFKNGKDKLMTKVRNYRNKDQSVDENMRDSFDDYSTDEVLSDKDKSQNKGANKVIEILKFVPNKIVNHFKNNQKTYAYYVQNFVARVKLGLVGIRKSFKRNILGKPEDRRFIGQEQLKRNRYIFVIAIVILSGFLYTQLRAAQKRSDENNRIEQAQLKVDAFTSRYDQIVNAVDTALINNNSNKGQITTQITQLVTDINAEKSASGLFTTELDQLLANLSEQEDKLLNKFKVKDADVLVDVAKLYQGVELSDFEEVGNDLFITDIGQNSIYKVPKTPGGQLSIHIGILESPSLIVRNALGEMIVYDQNAESAIGKFDPATIESFTRFPALPISNIGTVNEVAVFEGNNALYEIRQSTQQIYKRERIGEEYAGGGAVFDASSPSSWKVDQELGGALDIEAPFELYTVVQSLGVRRYLGGGENGVVFETYKGITLQDFDVIKNGVALDVTNFGGTGGSGYLAVGVNGTATAEGKVYIFEITGEEKSLTFVKQLVSDPSSNFLKNIKEIQIDPVNSKIFVLDANKVLTFQI